MKIKNLTPLLIFCVEIQSQTLRQYSHWVMKNYSLKNIVIILSPFVKRTRRTISQLDLHLDFLSAVCMSFLLLFSTLVGSSLIAILTKKVKPTI